MCDFLLNFKFNKLSVLKMSKKNQIIFYCLFEMIYIHSFLIYNIS